MIEKRNNKYWTIRFTDRNTHKNVRLSSPAKLGLSSDKHWDISLGKKEMKRIEHLAIDTYYKIKEKELSEDATYKNTLEYLYNCYDNELNNSLGYQSAIVHRSRLNKHFFCFFDMKKGCSQFDIEMMQEIKQDLVDNLKVRSVNIVLSSIIRFLDYITTLNKITYDEFRTYKKILSSVNNSNEIDQAENFLTPEEIKHFLEVVKSNQTDYNWYLFYEVAYYGALRLGELLALTFADIDYNAKTLRINKSLSANGRKVLKPKTTSSNSVISLSDRVIKELEEYQKTTLAKPSDRVFFADKTFDRLTLLHKLTEFLKIAGLKKITMHGFRHSMASYMFSKGIPLTETCHHLRHKNPSITLAVYTHRLSNDNSSLINSLDLG